MSLSIKATNQYCIVWNIKQKALHLTKRQWIKRSSSAGPNFIEPLSTNICLAWNVCLDKNRSWIPVTSKMQQMEIWLVILFLSRKKFPAKQIFVLSSSMKLGPECTITNVCLQRSQYEHPKTLQFVWTLSFDWIWFIATRQPPAPIELLN